MKPILITQEQNEAIRLIFNSTQESVYLKSFAKLPFGSQFSCLNSLTFEQLTRILYVPDSYEIGMKFTLEDAAIDLLNICIEHSKSPYTAWESIDMGKYHDSYTLREVEGYIQSHILWPRKESTK